VLPFSPAEREFLERINGQGEIQPDLVTDDPLMRERLVNYPMLLWKAKNIRNYRHGDR